MKYFIVLAFLFGAVAARAGDFYEKDGFALNGYDPISFFEPAGPQLGSQKIASSFRGSSFLFSSEEHKKQFLADPEKFSPQFNGFCAFGMAKGYKAKTEPDAYSVVDGKLYLNYDQSVQKKWSKNRESFIERAEENWPTAKSSTKVYQ